MVVDDAAGYFGGMNIIDNAEPVRPARQRPASSGGWRDVHVRLAGPQQGQLAESFDRSWCRAQGRRKARLPRAALRAELRQVAGGQGAGESIHFFDSGPRGPLSRAARVYRRMVQRAQSQITLAMAYFVPVGGVLRALLAARKRRVGVCVIVPGRSDVAVVQRATAYLYDRLIRRGWRIYERRQQMLHSKVMIVDELYTLVGSANLDPRSLYINLEFLAVIRSAEMARLMQEVCRFEMAHSRRITMEDCRRIGW